MASNSQGERATAPAGDQPQPQPQYPPPAHPSQPFRSHQPHSRSRSHSRALGQQAQQASSSRPTSASPPSRSHSSSIPFPLSSSFPPSIPSSSNPTSHPPPLSFSLPLSSSLPRTPSEVSSLAASDLSRESDANQIELPRNFEDAPIEAVVVLVADMLERLTAINDQIVVEQPNLTRFHSRTPPSISIHDYLARIVQYTKPERSCLLLTLHYIDLICARNPSFALSSLTVHRFLIASITCSSKALCDVFCRNSHYARVGGLGLGELNLLEREFLGAIDWRLATTRELIQSYYKSLVSAHPAYRLAHVVVPEHQAGSRSASMSSSSSDAEGGGGEGGDVEMTGDLGTQGGEDSASESDRSMQSAQSVEGAAGGSRTVSSVRGHLHLHPRLHQQQHQRSLSGSGNQQVLGQLNPPSITTDQQQQQQGRVGEQQARYEPGSARHGSRPFAQGP